MPSPTAILSHLHANPGRHKLWNLAVAMDAHGQIDAFRVSVDAIPARQVVRVRGQNGFLQAA